MNPSTEKYFLPPEHALALSDSNSPIIFKVHLKQ